MRNNKVSKPSATIICEIPNWSKKSKSSRESVINNRAQIWDETQVEKGRDADGWGNAGELEQERLIEGN